MDARDGRPLRVHLGKRPHQRMSANDVCHRVVRPLVGVRLAHPPELDLVALAQLDLAGMPREHVRGPQIGERQEDLVGL